MSEDIIEELLKDGESERVAAGRVDGRVVELRKTHYRSKTQEQNWKVVAEAPNMARWREQETFHVGVEANEYFEKLMDKYDLNEGPAELLEDDDE